MNIFNCMWCFFGIFTFLLVISDEIVIILEGVRYIRIFSMATGIWNTLLADSHAQVTSDQDVSERTLLILGGTPDHQSQLINSLYETQQDAKSKTSGNSHIQVPSFLANAPLNTKKESNKSLNLPVYGYTFLNIYPSSLNVLLHIHTFPGNYKTSYKHYLDKILMNNDNITIMILVDSSNIILHNNKIFTSTTDQLILWITYLKHYQQKSLLSNSQTFDYFMRYASKYGRDVDSLKSSKEFENPLPWSTLFVVIDSPNLEYKITKSHLLDELQQTLRTIALSNCSSLFYLSYKSSLQQSSRKILTDHLVNTFSGIIAEDQELLEALFEDPVSIPVGWDSWGKIKTLDDNFNCAKVLESWSDSLNMVCDIDEIKDTDDANSTFTNTTSNTDELKDIYETTMEHMFQKQQSKAASV